MLKILPSHVSNLIAAGEVVQRPANVVKELMENAIDAGATQVTVVINDCGKTLIQVIDNGAGMTREDAELCFARHATSKIQKAEDLHSISTFGFRGEALASIAACADVTLKTRKRGEECGTEVHIAESSIISTKETECAEGSNFAIRNIFYNIPARRKFLKSDNAEYRQIVSEFTRVALTKINIEFRLVHNSKDIFHLLPTASQKQRIIHLCGKDLSKDLVDISTETTVVNVSGFIGKPEFAKKSQANQFLFVNGRYFKSSVLYKAILKAYNNLIPDGYTPSYFVFLEVDPNNMDVNIHPAKTEIKFENEGVIFEILTAAIKKSIGGSSFLPSIDFDTEGVPEIPVISTGFEHRYVPPPKIDYDPLFNPFDEEKKSSSNQKWNSASEWKSIDSGENSFPEFTSSPTNYFQDQAEKSGAALFNEEAYDDSRSIIQIKGRYAITPVKSGLMMIDIYRAKERIIYEKYLNSIRVDEPIIQESLFPKAIDLDHNSYSIIMENNQILKQLGFEIRSFGDDCIVVYGIPASLSDENLDIEQVVDSLIADLKEGYKDFEQEFKERIALKMTKSSGVRSINNLNNTQIRELIDTLFSCGDPNITPDGKKCIIIVPIDELIKKF